MFAAFIVLCGFTHFLEVWTFYHPIYRFSGLLKAITAVISIATAIALIPLVPKVLNFTSVFQSILQLAPDGIMLVDAKGQITMLNQRAVSMFGYEENELYEKSIEEVIPNLSEQHKLQKTTSEEFVGVGKDKSQFPLEVSYGLALAGEDEQLYTNIIRDISVRKQVEAQLQNNVEKLAHTNEKITASIRYARLIEQAILPKETSIKNAFPNSFIVFMPKDIVSGDFYWFAEIDTYKFIAVGDCTGHGVPGVLLSMIGNMLLNEIVKQNGTFEPGAILKQLHLRIKEVLQQKDKGDITDGMDICICRMDQKEANTILFAGAKRPLWIVEKNKLRDIKGERKSIGGRQKERQRMFATHKVEIKNNSMVYLASDGFADQSNPHGKKLGSKALKSTLESIATKPANEQKNQLLSLLKKHQQEEQQRDDITIIGIKF